MKKHLFAISFLISAIVLIAHDSIPHHHIDMDESESIISHIFKDNRDDHAKNENNRKQSLPHHQHVFAPDDLITRRNNISLQKEIKFSVIKTICRITFSGLGKDSMSDKHVFKTISFLPDPYPFIISPNAMRGSPATA